MQRTGLSVLRTVLAILAAAVLVMGAGLMAWPIPSPTTPDTTTATPGGVGEARPVGDTWPPPSTGVFRSGVAPERSSVAAPATAVSWFEATSRRQVDSPFRAEATPDSPPFVARLPSPTAETAPDGLPVSALRCSYDGGTSTCGDCRTDGDCPVGQGCVANRRTRRMECMSSECEEDSHCFPGLVCRAVSAGTTGPAVIRRCVPEGLRREGEHCDTLPISPTGSCREGLVCLAGICGVRCRADDPSSCPAGYSCEDSLNGPGCYPDCRKLGCPEGQRCKTFGSGRSQCLATVHGDCPESPCGEGERCNMFLMRGHGVFWCARVCNPLLADSCPTGQVCGMGSATVSTCYRKCDPMDLDSCGEGWSCTSVSEDMRLRGCMPRAGR